MRANERLEYDQFVSALRTQMVGTDMLIDAGIEFLPFSEKLPTNQEHFIPPHRLLCEIVHN